MSIGVFDSLADTKKVPDVIRQLIRCKQQFYGTPRYDWVALYDLADKDFKTRQGMDKYLFAQVRLLFEIQQNNIIYKLAYLEWYNITDVPEISVDGKIKMVSRDPETQMAVAVRSREFNVVSVDAIKRAIHMQPLFVECDSARKMLANKQDVYSFDSYLVNKYVDRISWEELF